MSKNNYSAQSIAEKTRLYFEGVNNIQNPNEPTVLTEEAQANVMEFERKVMGPYKAGQINSSLTNAIKTGEDIFRAENPTKANEANYLDKTNELETAQVRALVKKEEGFSLTRAGYINLAILLYGTFNIGVIIAIALMK